MGSLKNIREDNVALNEGKWFDWVEGIRLLIASSDCSGYQLEMERQALTRATADLEQDQDAIQVDMRVAAGKFLLLGWENIQDDDANDIPYSEDQAVRWLSDPDYFPLYRFVRDKATSAKNFRKAEKKVTGK